MRFIRGIRAIRGWEILCDLRDLLFKREYSYRSTQRRGAKTTGRDAMARWPHPDLCDPFSPVLN
jgi:hypothetical protein